MVKAASAQSAAHGLQLHWSPQRILRSQYETCHLLPLEKRPSLSSGAQFLHHMSPSILRRAAKGTALTIFPVNGQWHPVRDSAPGHSNSVLSKSHRSHKARPDSSDLIIAHAASALLWKRMLIQAKSLSIQIPSQTRPIASLLVHLGYSLLIFVRPPENHFGIHSCLLSRGSLDVRVSRSEQMNLSSGPPYAIQAFKDSHHLFSCLVAALPLHQRVRPLRR